MQITLLSLLDYAGVATFAASGALMAAEKRQDILTFIFFAAITGVGGGTLRDLLIGAPVFWVQDPAIHRLRGDGGAGLADARARLPGPALLWLDAMGLCIYATVGAAKALSLGVSPVVCVVMGAHDRDVRRHHPRRAGGRAFDPAEARALHHSGDRQRRRVHRAGVTEHAERLGERHRRGAGLRRARRRDRFRLEPAGVQTAEKKNPE